MQVFGVRAGMNADTIGADRDVVEVDIVDSETGGPWFWGRAGKDKRQARAEKGEECGIV